MAGLVGLVGLVGLSHPGEFEAPHQSKAVRALAERIKKTFLDFRNLLKKYEQNIEVVDPQLKNNVELVEILVEFENTWT